MRYIVQRDYDEGAERYAAGDVVELTDDYAAWLNRNSPGVIVPEPAPRAPETPESDRMVRKATKRGSK